MRAGNIKIGDMAATQRERINFSKIKEVIDFPNLIEIQKKSYAEFLQLGVDKTKRVEDGLEAVFKEVFPIESYDGSITLDFHSYEIRPPKQTWLESLDDGGTYGPRCTSPSISKRASRSRKRKCSWAKCL